MSNATRTRQERNARAQQAGAAQAGAKRIAANLGQRNRITAEQMQSILGPIRTALLAFRMGTAGTRCYHDMAAGLSVAYWTASKVQRHRDLLPDIKAGLDALTAIFDRGHEGCSDDTVYGFEDLYIATDEEFERIELAARIYEAILQATTWPFLKRAINDALPKGES